MVRLEWGCLCVWWVWLGGYGWFEPVGLRASGESIVTISLGDMRRGMAWRESHAAVLVA